MLCHMVSEVSLCSQLLGLLVRSVTVVLARNAKVGREQFRCGLFLERARKDVPSARDRI